MEIKDELEEIVFLKNPRIMICEWIPFNKNQIMTINDDLETTKRIKSNLFTSRIDTTPHTATFTTNPVFTEVKIKDYDVSRFVRFDAQVFYPEDVVQIERFGVNIDFSGRVIYGLALKDIDGCKEVQSLDKMSRVISDVVLDSSVMVDTLLSVFQKRLLDVVFFDDSKERDKFTVIIGDEITPHFDDNDKYLDKEKHENELNQVLEAVHRVVTLSPKEKVFVGSHGIILVSPDSTKYEEIVSVAAFLYSLQILQRNISTRMWILWDQIRETREKILAVSESDTEGISHIQEMLSQISGTIVLLEEITKYMSHSTAYIRREWNALRKKLADDECCANLVEALEIDKQAHTRGEIITDIKMGISGLQNEISGLRDIAGTIAEKQMKKVNEALQENIAEMQEMTRASDRTGSAVEVLEIILAGSISFDIVNTFSGEYTNEPLALWAGEHPSLWFLIILMVWGVIGWLLYRIMDQLQAASEKDLRITMRFDHKVDTDRLKAYMATKEVLVSEETADANTRLKRVSWKEDILDHEASLQISFEAASGILRTFSADVPSPGVLTARDVKGYLVDQLKKAEVITEDEPVSM